MFVAALMIIPSFMIGGLRLAILFIFGIYFWGAVDMWDTAMDSMAFMGLCVFLSILVGCLFVCRPCLAPGVLLSLLFLVVWE